MTDLDKDVLELTIQTDRLLSKLKDLIYNVETIKVQLSRILRKINNEE